MWSSRPVKQCVFYVGTEPMRLPSYFEEDGTRHPYELVNLQDYGARELLASPDWATIYGPWARKGTVQPCCWRSSKR